MLKTSTETCSFHASLITTDGEKNQEDFFSAMGITRKDCEKHCLSLYKECHRQQEYFLQHKRNRTRTAMHLEVFYILRKLKTGCAHQLQQMPCVHTAATNIHITRFIDFGI